MTLFLFSKTPSGNEQPTDWKGTRTTTLHQLEDHCSCPRDDGSWDGVGAAAELERKGQVRDVREEDCGRGTEDDA